MKKIFYTCFIVLLIIVVPLNAQTDLNGDWDIIQDQSTIEFKISSMYLFNVKGTFSDIDGSFTFSDKMKKIDLSLKVESKSLDTGNEKRDDHLKSDDFFDVEKYPIIKFVANEITAGEKPGEFTVKGMLTIKDVTKEKNVNVKFDGFSEKDKKAAVFTGSTEINRRTYNIDFDDMAIGDVADLSFNIVAKRN